jgi:hypothetical protein
LEIRLFLGNHLETTFYVFLPVMSHCSDLSDDMPVNNSLLNPPSKVEKITAVNWASCNDDGGFGKRDRGFRIRAERGQKERRPEGEEVSDHSLPVG